MILLLDIGNTHTHLGLAGRQRIGRQSNLPTADWSTGRAALRLIQFTHAHRIDGVVWCSVVPRATAILRRFVKEQWSLAGLELSARTVRGIGIDYPAPESIGADRLANAVAARHHFGAPVVVVDFGTAVTFDVVNRRGDYVGGVISPGLSAMTTYLHEKTALLPEIQIQEVNSMIGKSTTQAMLIGAVHGYRGLIRELLRGIKQELRCRRLPVVATGGYARLIARKLPEITAVEPLLTLEGLRLVGSADAATCRLQAGR